MCERGREKVRVRDGERKCEREKVCVRGREKVRVREGERKCVSERERESV